MKVLVVFLVIVALGLGGAAGFFFMELDKAKKEVDKTKFALDGKGKELAEAQDALGGMNEAVASAKADADKAKAAQVKAQEEKSAADAKVKVAQDALAAQKKAADAKAAELQKAQNELKAALEAAKQENAGLTGKVADLEKKVAALTEAATVAKDRVTVMTKDLTAAKAVADKAKSKQLTWNGVLLLEAEKPQEALKEFEGAFMADGANGEACKGMALSCEALGDKEQAAKCWQNFIATGPAEDDLEMARQHLESLKE